jgi:hypothetical protein
MTPSQRCDEIVRLIDEALEGSDELRGIGADAPRCRGSLSEGAGCGSTHEQPTAP